MATETTTEIERNENGSRIFVTAPVINPKNIHIIYYKEYDIDDNIIGEYWGISREGQKENLATLPTKKEAINEAKKIKMDDDVIIVHDKDGQLECYIQ
jgi:hypothetical protein